MPGEQCGRIEKVYGKRDSSLALGHLVYDRHGFFRQFLDEERDQSSILIEKGKVDGLVTWKLKPETDAELRKLGVIRDDFRIDT